MTKKGEKNTEKVVALSLRLPAKLHSKLLALATAEKRSVNKQAQMLLEKELI